MRTFLRLAVAFVAAVLSTSVLASIFSTQSVIASLQAVGTDIPIGTRLNMTLVDFKILETLALVTAVCFLVGFIVAYLCNRFVYSQRQGWFVLAGATALVCTLLLLSWSFQLMPIAGARTFVGLSLQALAGGVGGLVFHHLSKPKKTAL